MRTVSARRSWSRSRFEADGRGGDDVEGEAGEIDGAVAADARQSRLDDAERVLGHVDEGAPRLGHVERAEAGGAAGNGDGDLEAEPTLAALGSAPEDTDARARPELVDEPSTLDVGLVEIGGAGDGERVGHAAPAGKSVSSMACSMTASSMKLCSLS